MSSATTIREARLDDYPSIAAALTRNGIRGSKPREEWEYLWTGNPVYKKLNDWPIGWIAENANHDVVGYVGNIPLSCSFRGREIFVGCGHSWCMDSAYRGSAGFLVRRYLNYKIPGFTAVTTANTNSFKILEAFRMSRVPAGDWGQAAFWIADYHGFVASGLSKRGWPTLLAYPAAAFLSLKDKLIRSDSWVRQNRGEIQVSASFDERFDLFWDELQKAYPDRMLGTRSSEVLRWHFKYALAQKRAWIVTAGDGSRLLAYGIFCRRDVPEHGLKRLQLIDFQALNCNREILVDMLAWGLTHCSKNGISMLEAFGFRPDKQAVIDSLAPHRRQLPSWWYYYKTTNQDLGPHLADPSVWDTSHFDGDTSL